MNTNHTPPAVDAYDILAAENENDTRIQGLSRPTHIGRIGGGFFCGSNKGTHAFDRKSVTCARCLRLSDGKT